MSDKFNELSLGMKTLNSDLITKMVHQQLACEEDEMKKNKSIFEEQNRDHNCFVTPCRIDLFLNPVNHLPFRRSDCLSI